MYASKIERLLNNTTKRKKNDEEKEKYCYQDESRLVAIAMLVNPNIVVDSSEFTSLWLSEQYNLSNFCQRLLISSSSKSNNNQSDQTMILRIAYARLILLLLNRILRILDEESNTVDANNSHRLETSAIILFNQIFDFLSQVSKDERQMTIQVLAQIVESINYYFTIQYKISNSNNKSTTIIVPNKICICLNEFLDEILWDCYCEAMRMTTITMKKTQKLSNEESLMEQTLQAVLSKSTGDDDITKISTTTDIFDDASLQTWKQRLHQAMEDFYRNHLLRLFAEKDINNKNDQLIQSTILQWLKHILFDLQFPVTTKAARAAVKPTTSTTTTVSTDKKYYYVHQLPQPYQESWHETLLLYLRHLASHHDYSFIKNMMDSSNSNNNNIRLSVIRLILIHVVSPLGNEMSEAIRSLAWTTCAALVDRLKGYYWILIDENLISTINIPINNKRKNNSQNLGSASHLCALLRLASGEWRIQLERRLSMKEKNCGTIESNIVSSQQRASIFHACAQLLGSLVSFLTMLAEELETNEGADISIGTSASRSISPEALLHLRDSLEDALYASCNYLCQLSKSQSLSSSSSSSSSSLSSSMDTDDLVVVQLMGTFLTEFDIFDGQSNLDSDQILIALRLALLNCTSDTETQERLIASLTGVLETAQDDSFRVLLLKEHDLLGNALHYFLSQYWKNNQKSFQSIPWACHLTELWYTMLEDYQSELRLSADTSDISKAIIEWIRLVLRNKSGIGIGGSSPSSSSSSFVSAETINACIGCFVTLQGEIPPNQEDGEIIQEALQFCASHP